MELNEAIEKSFRELAQMIPKDVLLEFSQSPEDKISDFKFGVGTIIRIKMLNNKNLLYKGFLKTGITDRDEMIMIMLKRFHTWLQSF